MKRTTETKTIEQDAIYEKWKKSRFRQQRLPALRPVPTLTSTIVIYCSIGVLCIAFGVVLHIYSNKIRELIIRYDEDCGTSTPCYLNIKINETLKAPIMVHYQLNNFYQNHRSLLKSFSPEQLKGNNLSLEYLNESGLCNQTLTNEEAGKMFSYNGDMLDPNLVSIPCGLMPKSFFSDGYKLTYPNETEIPIDEKNISYPEDRKKYKNMETKEDPEYWHYAQWLDMTDEHFIVWMRPAAYPNFRKLWGRIREDIEPGDYILKINNTFEVSLFGGEKYFILSTVTIFGGKNVFLSYCYMGIGGVSILIAAGFLVWTCIHNNSRIKI